MKDTNLACLYAHINNGGASINVVLSEEEDFKAINLVVGTNHFGMVSSEIKISLDNKVWNLIKYMIKQERMKSYLIYSLRKHNTVFEILYFTLIHKQHRHSLFILTNTSKQQQQEKERKFSHQIIPIVLDHLTFSKST